MFRQATALLKKQSVKDVRGTLTKLSTLQGGKEVTIKIEVEGPAGNVTFDTGMSNWLKRGTAVYNQIGELAEGQCVVFSAKNLDPASLLEKSKVCDWDFHVKFTQVKPCP